MKFKTTILLSALAFLILSCNDTNKRATDPITPAETRSTMEFNKNRLDSIPGNDNSNRDFKASGSEPFWNVEISDKKIHFQSPDKNYQSISATVNTIDMSGSTITFNAENDNETVRIALIEEKCIDGMNGRANSHKVEVTIIRDTQADPKTYEGCGSFLND